MPRRRILIAVGVLVLLGLVVLAVFAWSLNGVRKNAMSAKTELTIAKQSLMAGDSDGARTHTELARRHVDDARSGMEGVGARFFGALPVTGGAMSDISHLLAAMDHATSMAESGVEVYPSLTGAGGTPLYDGTRIDVKRLPELAALADSLGQEAVAAQGELDDVDADAPLIGGSLKSARDEADATISPIADGYRSLKPLIKVMPEALGADGGASYLIAIMNPAELRWSGGATLSMSTLSIGRRGAVAMSDQITLSEALDDDPQVGWEPVRGNPFHFPGEDHVANATFNPDWSVSAEELQRAWASLSESRPTTGVVAIDLPALAMLLDATGPMEVEGIGTVTGDNLVEILAGSYDETGIKRMRARHRLNVSLAEVFKGRLFSGANFVEKGQALAEGVRGRHLAFWSSDPAVQAAFSETRISGELSDAPQDYLGVFTQNANASKTDYWQKRSLDSVVRLQPDGSARVRLVITLHNDTPPFVHSDFDPRTGYWTRFNTSSVLQMLPIDARLQAISARGSRFEQTETSSYRQHPYVVRRLKLRPQAVSEMVTEYTVPRAAVADGDALDYRLTYDPQGMVNAQSLKVTVVAPEGYDVGSLPDGWSASEVDGHAAAVLEAPEFDKRGDWQVPFSR